MNKIAIFFINVYQKYISILFPKTCRFYPTCSSYSKDAFNEYGFLKALILTIKRILKCHPFHEGGYDPLPKKGEENENNKEINSDT